MWQALTSTFTFLVGILLSSVNLVMFSLLGGTSSTLKTFLGGTSEKTHPVAPWCYIHLRCRFFTCQAPFQQALNKFMFWQLQGSLESEKSFINCWSVWWEGNSSVVPLTGWSTNDPCFPHKTTFSFFKESFHLELNKLLNFCFYKTPNYIPIFHGFF